MKEKQELTRCFIAIDFPDSVIKEVARVQEILEGQKFTGKMTELENLHLTLKFLGEINDEMIEKVRERLKGIKFNEIECSLCGVGTFGKNDGPKIVWIKVCGEGIWELQKKIDDALLGLFKKEERFMSHLTIARLKYVRDKKGFIEYVKNIGLKEVKFKVRGFELKKSELRPLGPVYTTVEKYECGSELTEKLTIDKKGKESFGGSLKEYCKDKSLKEILKEILKEMQDDRRNEG